jgi:hypothetical protein
MLFLLPIYFEACHALSVRAQNTQALYLFPCVVTCFIVSDPRQDFWQKQPPTPSRPITPQVANSTHKCIENPL